jgi:hypothetical protein
VFWQAEENHPGDSQILQFATLFGDLVRRFLVNPRHRANLVLEIRAWADKHRIDKTGCIDATFANKSAE